MFFFTNLSNKEITFGNCSVAAALFSSGAWVLNKLKNDESFKHQLADFEQFLSTESKTEENKLKDKNLFKGLLWDD